jgi:Flp pilus assembly protein TadG
VGLRPRRGDRGAIAVIVAALSGVLFGLAAMVVDLGIVRDRQRTAQNAADAAALAAAGVLSRALNPAVVTPTEIARARASADQYVAANGWDSGIDSFTVDPATATVTVTLASVPSPNIFAGALGSSPPSVAGRAGATWRNAPAPCALCVLGNLSAQNGQAVNSQGSVLIRGALSVAANGSVITSGGIVGVGGIVSNNGTVTPDPVAITPVTDPYAVSPILPPRPPAPALGAPAVNATGGQCSPGTYADVTACRVFAPGAYVITGQNRFTGNIVITANDGVLFYVTCSTGTRTGVVSAPCAVGQQGGSLEFTGTVSARIKAMTDPAYRGLAIVYDRNNTAPLGLVGGPDITIDGGVYGASATLRNNGTGPLTVNGTMVVGAVDLRGVPATVNINEDNAFADLPPFLIHLT